MTLDQEKAVLDRYSKGAQARENELCCPISYDGKLLAAIPEEVLERDYGCGDPSAHLRPGETVLDLGSGGGKICFIASQVVGESGRVIGVDMNPDMLELARRAAPRVAEKTGFANVEFLEGRIQDLATDPRTVAAYLVEHPVATAHDALAMEAFVARQRRDQPLIASESIDVVVSNCVLNLVLPDDKDAMFAELFRVTKVGGRVVISDIVSDEEVGESMRADPDLWSGCISGAYREDAFLHAFVDAGFYGVRVLKRDEKPWRTVEGIEFRSVTVEAFKGKQGPCWEGLSAVIYKGPFSHVRDDDGHAIPRGVRYAVCDKTFDLFQREPYRDHFDFVEPLEAPAERIPFDCARDALRDPRATKGVDYDVTSEACTGPDCC
ncbi:MAG: methyltransferase domain-containing protein [Planctomycetota bacterium]|jgi:ubiquinone/menaquinone biosynthesis C-methylase UbiE